MVQHTDNKIHITLQYFDDCPSWETADSRMRLVLEELSIDAEITRVLIDTPELAAEHHFRGSPSLLFDGDDPFADMDAPVGLSCRVYRTESGTSGSPSKPQLETAILALGSRA